MNKRVRVPEYTGRWIEDDQYGEVVRVTKSKKRMLPTGYNVQEYAHVKLDKSGKTVRVLLDDCTEV